MTWPGGLGGEAVIDAAARDLVTTRSGAAVPVATARLHATIGPGRIVTRIDATPAPAGLQGLAGHSGGSGYRKLLRHALPAEAGAGSPLYFLLDDMPGVTLVGPFAWRLWPQAPARLRGLGSDAERAAAGIRTAERMRDICSGFRSDGRPIERMMTGEDAGHNLVPARDLAQPEDPLAWHPIAGQPDGGPLMRRRRLVDVTDGPELVVRAIFRDSIWGPDGAETCVHEYGLHATVDPAAMRLTGIRADPRVLPFATCPAAGANADLLLGEPVRSLRERVIELIAGTDGCTHLNDALRALAEVPVMIEELARADPEARAG